MLAMWKTAHSSPRSTRFIIFDQYANIITDHQTEFRQILPHAGWHEQDPEDLVGSVRECIDKAMEKLDVLGWSKDSVKGIGKSKYSRKGFRIDPRSGITNQRETTVCWSRSTGKPLLNAIVWDDARTTSLVRHFEKKLDEEGIEIDEEDEDFHHSSMGTGKAESAFGQTGHVVSKTDGVVGGIGKVMEGLGLAGRGKVGESKRSRKGKEGLLDM